VAKSAPSPLIAAVLACAKSTTHWSDKVPDEFRRELFALRDAFRAGEIPAKRYVIARVAIAHGQERGVSLPSEKVLAEWLKSER